METFELTERITKDRILIKALSWKIEDWQHTFYCDNGFGQVIVKSYSTRYYDLTDRYGKRD